MDCKEEDKPSAGPSTAPGDANSGSAVNSLILDYYKKFGRKRDLEQYFSLSTAQSDVKDPSGTFWRNMKSENDSSDSGGKKSESSQELCRISIRCSVPDPSSSQEEDSKPKSESGSPPIITEEAQNVTQNSDDESNKSFDNNSQKSFDVMDTSANKPLSPTSSVTSQRKLEWDSLADVGYANESDRKTSASTLSTLERLALQQQYSNNDTKLDSIIEPPTAHSTPLDENDSKSKTKKGVGKKSTKICKKDVDYLEVNVPQSSDNNPPQLINVNLTKHISFNVERTGKVTIDNVHKDISISPEKAIVETPRSKIDKDVQTSIIKNKDSSIQNTGPQKIPVFISLNTLRRNTRRKKLRTARKRLKLKKKCKENIPVQEKSGEQLSEAESFEYMPGHMYNQNQLTVNDRSGNTAGNRSSLESSGLATTDSSKASKHSFTKDLQKSIDILKAALQNKCDDTLLRKKLIKQVCERLLKSRYRDDESTSDFLSGLSFSSKKLGLGDRIHTPTSTSDNSGDKIKRPKKSILRNDKFNAGDLASTSQSAPNLPTASKSDKLVLSSLMKNLTTSNTDSDLSKEKSSSDNVYARTSSQELYQKYLDALKREEAYKQHLKDKEMFLKQKLVCSSDSALKVPARSDIKVNNRLKDLIKDLTRNNYDDGSGDASKLEGGPNSSRDLNQIVPTRSQRSHSVFTLSSGGNSDQNKKQNFKKRLQCDLKDLTQPGTSREHYCCCPHHSKSKTGQDSSGQVGIRCGSPTCENRSKGVPPRQESPQSQSIVGDAPEGIKYVCMCSKKIIQDVPDNFMVVKCSRLSKNTAEPCPTLNPAYRNRNLSPRKHKNAPSSPETIVPCQNLKTKRPIPETPCDRTTKSSQTNFLLKMLRRQGGGSTSSSSESKKGPNDKPENKLYEATRWLQTEISIDPKIPEPSLSDINIVTDCANLVSEHCRSLPIAKSSVTNVYNRQTTNTCCNSGSSKSSGTSNDIDDLFDDNAFRRNAKDKNRELESDRSEKYTIPIQGTNMTLMVSIGANEQRPLQEKMIGECVGTEMNAIEQGTSLTEECSKGVQFDVDLPLRPYEQKSDNCGVQGELRKGNVYTCLNAEERHKQMHRPVPSTYPRTMPVNEKKPVIRRNTDIGNSSKPLTNVNECKNPPKNPCNKPNAVNRCGCGCNKVNCSEDQCESQPVTEKTSVEKETQCTDPMGPICTCGCGGNKEICKKTCSKRKKSTYSQYQTQAESVKCSCGCPGDTECAETCKQRPSSSPKPCSVHGSTDKCNKSDNEQNLQNKGSDKSECSCGCGDDQCGNKCQEQKASASSGCAQKSVCSCGCEGDFEKCSKSCIERKNAEIAVSPKCSCGCGGSKKDCDKHCSEPKPSVSSKCSCGCEGYKEDCGRDCEKAAPSCGVQKDSSSTSSQTPHRTVDSGTQIANLRHSRTRIPQSDPAKASESEPDREEEDPILNMIQNITKKYSKKDLEKNKKKKCYREIMDVLSYLLHTDDENTDVRITSESSSCHKAKKAPIPKKIEKSALKSHPCGTESSDGIQTTDMPGTSTDSATCKVLNKIKKECERYHQKRCKVHSGKKCEASSSTSANCDQCRRVHHCSCRAHKCGKPPCKCPKKCDKKNPVAYNLILQSESISEDTTCIEKPRTLKNILVKVPKKKFCKAECSPRETKPCRSRSLPNDSEFSSMEEFLKSQACCTLREYLEKNRPDFIAKSSERQNCMRIISDTRASMRAAQRNILSVCMAQMSDVSELDAQELRKLAKELGRQLRQKPPAPKFISEREMKKHSERIYKSLPEVVRKKEDAKKENIKKTNLLMANIFKNNLQKKTLRGLVDISNYSPIIKI